MLSWPAALRRPPVAALLYGLLLAGMAAGQLASIDRFGEALASYSILGRLVPAAQFGLPALEALVALVALGRLLSSRLPPVAAKAAGLAGVLLALLWATLAVQAFARGLVVENCGCFGAYLTQELRWWALLEDAYMLLLALLAASSLGVGLALRKRSVLSLGVTAALLATPAATSAATERCCFFVDARVSGWMATTRRARRRRPSLQRTSIPPPRRDPPRSPRSDRRLAGAGPRRAERPHRRIGPFTGAPPRGFPVTPRPRAQPASSRSSFLSLSITRAGKSGSANGSSRPSPRSESSVARNER
jgi:hypothetical protein